MTTCTFRFLLLFILLPTQAGANPNYFLEMVGMDCEKATYTMDFGDMDSIAECLKTQSNLIKERWAELKAEGKVSDTPELKAQVDKLAETKIITYNTYSQYYNQLDNPDQDGNKVTNDEWVVLHEHLEKWLNAVHDFNTEIIKLYNAEIIAQGGHLLKEDTPKEYTSFLEMVGIDCEKATHNMDADEVDSILECLRTQHKITRTKWATLEAEGKVKTTPELKAQVKSLATKTDEKYEAYSEYHDRLPDNPSQHEQTMEHLKKIEWINSINENQTKIIKLFDNELNKNNPKEELNNEFKDYFDN